MRSSFKMATGYIKKEILVWNTNALTYDIFNDLLLLPVVISVEFGIKEI